MDGQESVLIIFTFFEEKEMVNCLSNAGKLL